MTHQKNAILMVFTLLVVLAVSGCISQETSDVSAADIVSCGNNIVEASEECDNSGCPDGAVCSPQCKCEAGNITPLPSVPE